MLRMQQCETAIRQEHNVWVLVILNAHMPTSHLIFSHEWDPLLTLQFNMGFPCYHITRFLLCFPMEYEVFCMFLRATHAGWQFPGTTLQSCLNSAGALSSLSESLIFPMVFNVSQEAATVFSVDDQECRSLLRKKF